MKAPDKRTGTERPRRRGYLLGLVRGVLAAEFLLLATWNRTGYSYVDWVLGADTLTALMAVAGIALLLAHLVMLRIAYVALRPIGIIASLLAIGTVLLAGSTVGILNLTLLATYSDFWIFLAACVFSIGINWTKLQSRMSGERGALKAPP